MAAEFQYLSYYTKYSCSGAFELANPHNTACFATAFGKIKGIKGSFSETYKILIYKASNRKVLAGGRSNKCFLNKQQLRSIAVRVQHKHADIAAIFHGKI